jgi:hypothetical protein
MPATTEAPSQPARLPGQQDCAAGQQNGHASGEGTPPGGGRRQLPPHRGAPERIPAGAEPRARSRRARPRPDQWAVRAVIKADTTEHRMQTALLDRTNDASCHATARAVASLIKAARDACHARRRLRDHWFGTSQEQAYQCLHAAETLMVDLVSPDEVDVTASRLHAQAMSTLQTGDPRLTDVKELAGLDPGPVKRLRLKDAMAASYAAADQAHVRLRNFRNVLCVTTVLIVVLMGLFVFLVSKHPSMVPFCFTPSAGHHVCPTGSPGPARGDVIIVAGLGLLGGALAAAFAIRNIRGTSTPYDIPIALAALKVPTGALTAVAGLLLLRGQFVPGLSALDSQEQILAYALVLGYAQQLFTRLVDRQAQSILDNVPSKETGAVQPMSAPGPSAAITLRSS